ncbi:MAG: hypothetical protein L0Z55_11160, partial [Planctomycetes bacterium]|nr:hypothetical protein [Planctomycetota bacterium]
GPWMLRWRVDLTERVDGGALGAIALPPSMAGVEVWWVAPRRLTIDAQGSAPDLGRGRSMTWILLDDGWVVTEERAKGVLTRVPIARWNEERRREARAASIATVRRQGRLRNPESLAYFYGDLRRRVYAAGAKEGWHAVAAIPGRLWNLDGGSGRFRPVWEEPMLPLGFEGVSEERGARMQPILAEIAPRTIEEVALPEGERILTMTRTIEEAQPRADLAKAPAISPESLQALARREAGLDDAEQLWSMFAEEALRPEHLDRRAVRFLLAAKAPPAFALRVLARLDSSADVEESEELLQLLFALDRAQFDRRAAEAKERGDLPQLLAAISVLSLQDPRSLEALIPEVLDRSPALWEGLDPDEAEDARTWLAGTLRWVAAVPVYYRAESALIQ